MQIQSHNIRYIVLHVLPACDWRVMNYGDKMEFNYLVTSNGRKCQLASLTPTAGCISIAFVGSAVYARRSAALFSLLVDLSIEHPHAKICDSVELYQTGNAVLSTTGNWFQQQLPDNMQQLYVKSKNLLFLQSLFPRNN